jgi:hypothetical protein
MEKWRNVDCSVEAGTWISEGIWSRGKLVTKWPGSPRARCCKPYSKIGDLELGICRKCAALESLGTLVPPEMRELELLRKIPNPFFDSQDSCLVQGIYRRGFVCRIVCPWNFWLTHWREATQRFPLQTVELVTTPEWTFNIKHAIYYIGDSLFTVEVQVDGDTYQASSPDEVETRPKMINNLIEKCLMQFPAWGKLKFILPATVRAPLAPTSNIPQTISDLFDSPN